MERTMKGGSCRNLSHQSLQKGTDKNVDSLKIRRFNLNVKHENDGQECVLEGSCVMLTIPSAYMVTMEKPYKGLATAQYFPGFNYLEESAIKSFALNNLRQLYDQFQEIRNNYDEYKELLDEWKLFRERMNVVKKGTQTLRNGADKEGIAFLDFYVGMLSNEAKSHFGKLVRSHGINPICLTPQMLRKSIEIINEGGIQQ